MHRIYTSMALVIDSKPHGEADRTLFLYTKDFGLIRAIAKGVRLEKSKLRYSLALYSLSEVSLVKGREVWRLTSATFHKKYTRHMELLKKASLLIKRVSGEDTIDKGIFDSFQNYFEYLDTDEHILLKEAEIGIVLQILNRLGYIPHARVLDSFLSEPFSALKLTEITSQTEESIRLINQALRNTHL